MELLPAVCLCLLILTGNTSADGPAPDVTKVIVEEDSDAILPCSLESKENIKSKLFDWKRLAQKNEKQKEVFLYDAADVYKQGRSGQSEEFKGRVSHFEDQLKYGNASITITKAKVTDNGTYTCEFPRLQPTQIFYIELVVRASPKPTITVPEVTNNWALLQCEVRGAFPEPTVEWQDSSGKKLPAKEPQIILRGDRYDIILQTTVTKTDGYRCVATQETIYHQISNVTEVKIGGPTVTNVRQGRDVTLTCSLSTKENIESQVFNWRKDDEEEVFYYDAGVHQNDNRPVQSAQFRGRVFHFPDELKHGDASITIENTKMSDDGNYTCDFPHLQPRRTFQIKLRVVKFSESEEQPNDSGSNTGWIGYVAGVLCTVFVGVVIVAVLRCKGYTLNRKKGSTTIKLEQHIPLTVKPPESAQAPDPHT